MANVISFGSLTDPSTTSEEVDAEVSAMSGNLDRLIALRDKYRMEEAAGTRG